jgi:predicted PurR-regulated permease PerM
MKPREANSQEAPLPMDGRTRVVSRTILATILVLLALWIAQDFLAPLGWAIVIAIACWPIYLRFAKLFSNSRGTTLAPLLFTALVGLLLFFPVGLAVHQVSQEGQAIAQSISEYRRNGIPVPNWLHKVPAVGEHVTRWWQVNLSDAKAAGEWIGATDTKNDAAVTRAIGAQVLHRMFLFVVSLIALFGLLRHGPWIANRVLEVADRLLGDPGERLASKMVDAVRGTVNGTMTVAVVEGGLIGIAYLIAGLPNALLFTLLTMAFAMLPFGAWAVFTTGSILLALQGSVVAAFGVFSFGAVVMLIGDTFVWPKLVGNAARLPFLVALIGIFGGLQTIGLIGLFLGPVVMAALLTVWREWIVPSQ